MFNVTDLKVIIISGLSGSGKSYAIKSFEDMGFFCVDNLPSTLVPKFVELCAHSTDRKMNNVALGIDVREMDFLGSFDKLHSDLKMAGYDVEVVFLEASDEVLVRRFSESRRPHPVAKGKPLADAISMERHMMDEVKRKADRIIDTSGLTVHQLRDELKRHYMPLDGSRQMTISITSFGFKHGVPFDADLVFDVRFLPNPNFVPVLKELTGMQKSVQDYVKKDGVAAQFMKKLMSFMEFLIPLYMKEGKNYLTIAIGCTGGRHRSVAVTEMIREKLDDSLDIEVRHRDIEK